MPKGKKTEFKLISIAVNFFCMKCNKVQTVEVKEYDFSYYSLYPCDVCSSHIHFGVDVKCSICGKEQEIILRED